MANFIFHNAVTPVGKLYYTYFAGTGAPKFQKPGEFEFKSNLVVSKDNAVDFIKELTQIANEDGSFKYVPTLCTEDGKTPSASNELKNADCTHYLFKTSAPTISSTGKEKTIKVVDAKKNGLSIPAIGNGTEGRLSCSAFVWEMAGNQGVKLILNAIQITKLIAGSSHDDGFEEMDGFVASEEDKIPF